MTTPLKSQQHYDLIEQFERDLKAAKGVPAPQTNKEEKGMWAGGNIYQDGLTNQLFLAYRLGHAYGMAVSE
jgi:hypothetical protein